MHFHLEEAVTGYDVAQSFERIEFVSGKNVGDAGLIALNFHICRESWQLMCAIHHRGRASHHYVNSSD
ncbi:hypothetical protein D3C72_1312890 [compost metagenome]